MQTAKHIIAVCSQLSLISSYCYTVTIVEEIGVVGEGNETYGYKQWIFQIFQRQCLHGNKVSCHGLLFFAF